MADYSTDQIRALITLEARRQGIDPRLALAVATQESYLNPNAVGDNGKSLGLFQLQRAAAQDAGVDPTRRGAVLTNIRGGVGYLKQKLAQSDGNVEQALSRYNRGTPTYRGIGDPRYVENVMSHYTRQTPERPGLARKMVRAVSPASAEAATLPASLRAERMQETMPTQGEITERLQQLRARKQQLQQQAAPAPAPETPAPAPETSTDPRAGYEVEVIPGGTPAPGSQPAGAAAQMQLLEQQEQGRLAAERQMGSPAVPASPVARTALATGISTGAGMLGTAAGTLAMSFLGPIAPAGPVLGEMAGSYLGRRANVSLGLEAPGLGGDVASVAVPGATRLAAPVAKAVIKRLPGAQVAMHDIIGRHLSELGETFAGRIPTASRDLYEAVAKGANPLISPTAVADMAQELLQAEHKLAPALRNKRMVKTAEDLLQLTQAGGGKIPLDQLYAHQKRVGELTRSATRGGKPSEASWKRLYGAFHDDLATASQASTPEAQTLRQAIAVSRKEHAIAELEDLFTPGKPGISPRQGYETLTLNAPVLTRRFETKLARDKVFRESFTADELREVRDLLTQAQRLKAPTPGRGAAFGSGGAVTRGAVAAVVSAVLGADPQTMTIVSGTAAAAPTLLSWGFTTKIGRSIMRQALQAGHSVESPVHLSALATALRAATSAAQTPPSGGAVSSSTAPPE